MTSDEDLELRFGRHLRSRREQAGLTQDALAREANLSRTSVVNIEQGRQGVSLATLYRLASALNCPPAALLPEPETTPILQVRIGQTSKEDDEVIAALYRRASLHSSP